MDDIPNQEPGPLLDETGGAQTAAAKATVILRDFVLDRRQSILQTLYVTLLFAVMILGMVAKVVYDNLVKNESPPPLGWTLFTRPDVLLAIIVSPMVFGAVYNFVQSAPKGMGAVLFAFQNGFFWKTIFGGLDAPTTFVR